MEQFSYYIYDHHNNKAHKQKTDISFDDFSKSVEPDLYAVTSDCTGLIAVGDTSRQALLLRDVTEEQAVILMSMLKGLKEQAKE